MGRSGYCCVIKTEKKCTFKGALNPSLKEYTDKLFIRTFVLRMTIVV
jgi:hypothetical protein